MKSTIFHSLLQVVKKKGAGYIVLLDPDRKNEGQLEAKVAAINAAGVDAIFVGGSLMMDGRCRERVASIKALAKVPVIFFPGGISQLNEHYDAMLFMAILSGRNPHYLIGEQVLAAPAVKDLGIEVIPTGYLLFDGGAQSTVEFISNTRPIPLHRPDLAVAHALAAQYLGKKLIYLEAGSGAREAVPVKTIERVVREVEVPLIVGGGIRTPEQARDRVQAGASFIVTGTVIEEDPSTALMDAFAQAVHWKEQHP
jgi:phosphoglycerol geranylgeranyltransferase